MQDWSGGGSVKHDNDFLSTYCLADRSTALQGECVPECVSVYVSMQVKKKKIGLTMKEKCKTGRREIKEQKWREGGGGGTKAEYKETSIDAQRGVKIFTHLILSRKQCGMASSVCYN